MNSVFSTCLPTPRSLFLLTFLLVLPVVVLADPVTPDTESLTTMFDSSGDPGTIEPVENILVTISDDSIGMPAVYRIDFDLKHSEFVHLDYGGLAVSFPDGFLFSNLQSVTIADDHPIFEHAIRGFYVSSQTLFIDLKCPSCDETDTLSGRIADFVHITLTLDRIINPELVGHYAVAVAAYDKKSRLIAGPDLSALFSIGDAGEPDVPQIKICELTSLAPNAPYVNTGQQFGMQASLVNLTDERLDSVTIELASNGLSQIAESVRTFPMEPQDSLVFFFEIMAAAESNVGEQYLLEIKYPQVYIGSPVDRIENVIIQQPSSLSLSHDIFGVDNGVVPFGGEFSVSVELVKSGESSVSDATYILDIDPPLIDGYPQQGVLIVGSHEIFDFVAPSVDTLLNIDFTILESAIDLNTGELAPIDSLHFSFVVRPQSLDGDLLIKSAAVGNNLITPAISREALTLELTNRAGSSVSTMRVDSLALAFYDLDGSIIAPESVIDILRSGFSSGNGLSDCIAEGNRLICRTDNGVIEQGESITYSFHFIVNNDDSPGFIIRPDFNRTFAVYVDGPLNGSRPTVAVDPDAVDEFRFVVRGSSLSESVLIEQNPADPTKGPLRFSYFLNRNSKIEFRVFTLTGEEVYARDIPAGADGAVMGQDNILEWDGHNNSGQMVLNGVYLVHIYVSATGESTSLKVAVLK